MNIKEISTGVLFVKTYCFLSDDTLVIIDPGGTDNELMQFIEQTKANRISIILTHGHFDHVAGVAGIVKQYPTTQIFIHKDDKHYLGKQALETHLRCFKPIRLERYIEAYISQFGDFPEPTQLLEDGEIIHGLSVIHTPGHTPGSICLYDKTADVLFSGDTLFYRSRGRTDLYDGSESALLSSLRLLFERLPDSTRVLSGHSYPTTIGDEKNAQSSFL